MFKIGEFSRIARVSCRLLRYYDELGLLKPATIEGDTGYRYYSASQLPRLNKILVLKELGLTLEDIAAVVDRSLTTEQLRGMLLMRRTEAQRALAAEAQRLRMLEARIAQIDEGDAATADDVVIRPEPARILLSMRRVVPSFAAARQLIGQLCGSELPRVPKDVLGALAAIAHAKEFELDAIDLELGFYLTRPWQGEVPLAGGATMSVRELPAVDAMAACVRVGLPEEAHLITGKIGRFVEANGFRLAGPGREVFLQRPVPDRMEDSVVEMQFPVQREGRAPSLA